MPLRGVFVPLVTPFTAAGEVAGGALADLAGSVLDEGAAGLVALGTTAETATLDADERGTVVEVLARVCAERAVPLIVGAGGNDTRAAATALRALADRPGVTAALVPVPPYTRPGADGVLAHFAVLAAQSPVPLVVYHVPHRTGQELDLATLRQLAQHRRIAGVKYAVAGVDRTAVELLADPPAGFAVLAGEDLFLAPMLALGAAGGILASAQVCPRMVAELVAAGQAGAPARVRELGRRLAPLAAALFAAPNPAVIKGVLHAEGRIPTPAVRLPLLPADPALVAAARVAVARARG